MSDTWYYFLKDDRQFGPFTYQDLSTQLISRETLIWYEGLDKWQRAGDFPELSTLFHTPPPPPSSPPIPSAQSSSSTIPEPGQEEVHYQVSDSNNEPDLSPPELSVLAIFGKTTPGLFSKKPKFNQRLTHFYLVNQFQSMLEQNPANREMSTSTAGEIAAREISEGVEGLIQKGMATYNNKGVVLTETGFSFISQDK